MRNKKKVLALVAAVGVFGTLTASAATLGGLNSVTLGADQTVVAACDTDGIALDYTSAYDDATNSYKTAAVTLAGIADACVGSDFQLTLSNGTTALVELTGEVAPTAGAQVVTLASPVNAKDITAASVVITG